MDELIDRFGDVPPEAENLLWIALLRGLAAKLGIELVFLRMGKLLMALFALHQGGRAEAHRFAQPHEGHAPFAAADPIRNAAGAQPDG